MISLLRTNDAPRVAEIHLRSLPTSFRGQPGLYLLRVYYETLIASTDVAVGLKSVEGDVVCGYICGIWDREQLKHRLLKTQAIPLAFGTAWQLLTHHASIKGLLPWFWRSVFDAMSLTQVPTSGSCELRPVAVLPSYRRLGQGKKLVESLKSELCQRGLVYLYLRTEVDDAAANRLYLSTGFRLLESKGKINYYGVQL